MVIVINTPVLACTLRVEINNKTILVGCVAFSPKSRKFSEFVDEFWSFFKSDFRIAQRNPNDHLMSPETLTIGQNAVMRLSEQN